jgi:hypothetical protein
MFCSIESLRCSKSRHLHCPWPGRILCNGQESNRPRCRHPLLITLLLENESWVYGLPDFLTASVCTHVPPSGSPGELLAGVGEGKQTRGFVKANMRQGWCPPDVAGLVRDAPAHPLLPWESWWGVERRPVGLPSILRRKQEAAPFSHCSPLIRPLMAP